MLDREVEAFLAKVRKELDIQGLPRVRRSAVLDEVKSHLEEAMEARGNQTPEQVLRDFGSERKLAASLAAEYRRGTRGRRFLWPAGLTLALVIIFALIPYYSRIWLGSRDIWIGTLFLIGSATALAVLGYRARRASVGQFAALAAGLIASKTLFYLATGYPVAYGDPSNRWYEPTYRWAVASKYFQLREEIADEEEIVHRESVGLKTFTGPAPKEVPDYLRASTGYLVPEGVRESTLGIPTERLHDSLITPSWRHAVDAWTERHYANHVRDADWIIMTTSPNGIAQDEASIDSLTWIQSQSFTVQALRDLEMVWPVCFEFALLAAFATNLGWLLWLLTSFFARAARRIRYSFRLG